MRFFNTAGPVNCEDHYCLPPLERFDMKEIEMLLAQKKYFVLHAPRQTGKTSSMLALMEHLNRGGQYKAVYCNVEAAQAARENVEQAMNDIVRELGAMARIYLKDKFLEEQRDQFLAPGGYGTAVAMSLRAWAEKCDKPLVVMFDEVDSLVGDTLISFLRQIRSGYNQRPTSFPQSIMLCGIRDVRDYRIHASSEKEIITGGSAFNIKAESLRMGDFIKPEVYTLLEQHTLDTGQKFTSKAKACIWHLTCGQPWLVNALAYETCFKIEEGRDRSRAIDKDMVDRAKDNLIARRDTHLDQLADKLQEERVRRVISPMLQGRDLDVRLDDIQYVEDLGLIRRTKQGPVIANPIYAEVIPRELTVSEQMNLEARYDQAWYIRENGRLDVEKLLSAFQEFFREHSEIWLERFQYKEAGPQLLMQAFLQRIVNSGGRIEREYGLGKMRTDLLLLWPLEQAAPGRPPWTRWQGPVQKVVIELKILYKSLEKTIADGTKQTNAYMARCGTSDGHLVVFDRRPDVSWDEKIFQEKMRFEGREIWVWGM
jgi:hypothetical protein